MSEYFQKIDNANKRHILRKKVQIEEVEGLQESLNTLKAQMPYLYMSTNSNGVVVTNEGIYDTIDINNTLSNFNMTYDAADTGDSFSHRVAEAGTYKVSIHWHIKVVAFANLIYPTRYRLDLTKNNSNVGILLANMIAPNTEMTTTVTEGRAEDNNDNSNYEDMTTTPTGDNAYGRQNIDNAWGVAVCGADDVLRIRLYAWKSSLAPISTTPGYALDVPFNYRARILIEKIA